VVTGKRRAARVVYSVPVGDATNELRVATRTGGGWDVETIWTNHQARGTYLDIVHPAAAALDVQGLVVCFGAVNVVPADTGFLVLGVERSSVWEFDTLDQVLGSGFRLHGLESRGGEFQMLYECDWGLYVRQGKEEEWETDTIRGPFRGLADLMATAGCLHVTSAGTMDPPVYAYEESGLWHLEDVPDVAATGASSVALDSAGHVSAVFVCVDGLLLRARRATAAVRSEPEGRLRVGGCIATVLRPSELGRDTGRILDVQGRDVTEQTGALRPGIYFLRPEGPRSQGAKRSTVRKVIVTR